ncbi:MAG: hypothetical protein ACREOU_11795 [Candidatus Eiseniibacteriota bacterium]
MWGGSGTADGRFADPFGIAVDTEGHIYIADCLNFRIQRLRVSRILCKRGTA